MTRRIDKVEARQNEHAATSRELAEDIEMLAFEKEVVETKDKNSQSSTGRFLLPGQSVCWSFSTAWSSLLQWPKVRRGMSWLKFQGVITEDNQQREREPDDL